MTTMRGWMPCLLLLSLVACQREAESPGATPDASGPALVATGAAAAGIPVDGEPTSEVALGEFRIVSVLLGSSLSGDQLVATDSNSFAPGDTIHASVVSVGAHQGLRLSAKWLAPDGSTIAETQQPVVPVAAIATTFSVSNPQPWPEGEYRLQIAINGRPAQERTFQVR